MTLSPTVEAVNVLRSSPALAAWLTGVVDGYRGGPVEVELISGGRSNLTVALRVGGRDLVLRRPPVGAFLPSANDMEREHTFLAALAETAIPTPRPVALCRDAAVIGAPFYVDDLTFYVVLAAFKLSVIGLGQQAVLRRSGAAVAGVETAGFPLAEWALDLLTSNTLP